MLMQRQESRITSDFEDSSDFYMTDAQELIEAVIDGYSNQPRAILREYAANAWDAHIEVGRQDVPIRVTLPTRADPRLRIRDFGPGLSDEFMRTKWLGIGESTKRSTLMNSSAALQTGGFGVGRMSAFGATEQWHVTSIHKSMKATYVCTWDRVSPMKTIALGPPVATDEPDGLEIIVPIAENMIERYQREAEKVFEFFPTKPTINMELPEDNKPQFSGDTWACHGPSGYRDNGIRAVMGVVAYPVNLDEFRDHLPSDVLSFMKSVKADLTVPLGSLELLLSRETIRYRKRSIKTLTNALKTFHREFKEALSESLLDPELTDFERNVLFHKAWDAAPSGLFDLTNDAGDQYTHIKGQIVYRRQANEFEGITVRNASERDIGWYKTPRLDYMGNRLSMNFKNPVFVHDDLPARNRQPSRIWHNFKGKGADVYLIECPEERFNEIMAEIGNPDPSRIKRVSDLAPPPTAAVRRGKSGEKPKFRQLARWQAFISTKSELGLNTIIPEGDMEDYAFYILTEHGRPVKEYSGDQMNAYAKATDDQNPTIYFVPKSVASDIPDTWGDWHDRVREATAEVVEKIDIDQLAQQEAVGYLPYPFRAFFDANKAACLEYASSRTKGHLKQLFDIASSGSANLEDRSLVLNSERADDFISKRDKIVEEIKERREKIEEQKPLLAYVLFKSRPYDMDYAVVGPDVLKLA